MRLLPSLEDKQKKPAPVDEVIPCAFLDEKYLVLRIFPLYQQFFNLTAAPFSIAPDPHFIYMSEQHEEGFAHLLYGINNGGGFVALTGEVGTGKTTLCHCLLQRLPVDVDIALVFNPKLSALELLASICDELQIDYDENTQSLKSLIDRLNEHLLNAHAKGKRTVLLIDEAQNLSLDVLEQIRLLTNLETSQDKIIANYFGWAARAKGTFGKTGVAAIKSTDNSTLSFNTLILFRN